MKYWNWSRNVDINSILELELPAVELGCLRTILMPSSETMVGWQGLKRVTPNQTLVTSRTSTSFADANNGVNVDGWTVACITWDPDLQTKTLDRDTDGTTVGAKVPFADDWIRNPAATDDWTTLATEFGGFGSRMHIGFGRIRGTIEGNDVVCINKYSHVIIILQTLKT